MPKSTPMLFLLISLAVSLNQSDNVTLPCSSVPNTGLNIQNLKSSTNSITFTISAGANLYWNNPSINETAVLTIGNWTCDNYSLLVINVLSSDGLSQNYFNASIANNQSGVIYGHQFGNSYFVFAQICNANKNFQVQITSLSSSSFYFGIQMYEGNYNVLKSNTCEATCYQNGVQFALIKEIAQLNQFVCGAYYLFATLNILMMGALL